MDAACVVQLPALVFHGEGLHGDLGSVLQAHALPGAAVQIRHLGQRQGEDAEEHHQQHGNMQQEKAPVADAVFVEDKALADLLLFAAAGGGPAAQLLQLSRLQLLRIGQRRRLLHALPAAPQGTAEHPRGAEWVR